VEEVIRQQLLLEAYATLETYIILIQTRAQMLKKLKEPPPDMLEAITTIMYAADRVRYELDEVPQLAKVLMDKFKGPLSDMFSKEFPMLVTQDHTACTCGVNRIVVGYLTAGAASPEEKIGKLKEIAIEFNAPFDEEKAAREMLQRNPRMPPAKSPYDTVASGKQGYQLYVPKAQRGDKGVLNEAALAGHNSLEPPLRVPPITDTGVVRHTRPTNNNNWKVVRNASNSSARSEPSPWAPLPPGNPNLGLEFEDKLSNVATHIVTQRSAGSQEIVVDHAQRGYDEVNGGSGNDTPTSVAAVAPESYDGCDVGGTDAEVEAAIEKNTQREDVDDQEESLAARLARLKAL
jgi:hypothetical protein